MWTRNLVPLSFLSLLYAGHTAAVETLCTPPSPGQDDTYIACELERYTPPAKAPLPEGKTNDLQTIAYNIDRNGDGGDGSKENGLSPIISLLEDRSIIPEWDILFLSEVARHCSNWDNG